MARYKAPQIIEISEDEDGEVVVTHQSQSSETRPSRTRSRLAGVQQLTAPDPNEAVAEKPSAPTGKDKEICELVLQVASLRVRVTKQEQRCNDLQWQNDRLRRELAQKITTDTGRYAALCGERTKERDAAMRERDALYGLIDEQASCEICMTFMMAAYTLYECGHTFCQGCLTSVHNTALQKKTIPLCPKCRTAIGVPPCRNFAMEDLSSAAEAINKDEFMQIQ